MEKTLFLDFVQPTKAFFDKSGFLRIPARIGRVGVQKYVIDGKQVNVFRDPIDVSTCADSFSNVPVTLNHPVNKLVSTKNAELIKGFTGKIKYEQGWLVADQLLITHPDAIAAAQSTHPKLSCGYTARLVPEKGSWIDTEGDLGIKGKKYQYEYKQVDIKANHVALCDYPNAGDKATLLWDSRDDNSGIDNQDSPYTAILVDSKDYNIEVVPVTKEVDTKENIIEEQELKTLVLDAIRESIKNLEQEQLQNSLKEGRLAALEAENAQLKAEIESLKSQVPVTDSALIESKIQERLELWERTKDVLLDSIDYSLDVPEIKKLYITKRSPSLAQKLETKDKAFIDGAFEVLLNSPISLPELSPQEVPANDSVPTENLRNAFLKRMERVK